MITNVKFPKKGKGYIYEKPENPGKEPDKSSYEYWDWEFGNNLEGKRIFKDEKYNRDYERWAEDKKFYDENKGKFINPAAKYLVGRTFEFQPGKLNIIFGPNGCGKTTILKAIAGTAGIPGDGMTKPADPTDVFGWINSKEMSVELVAKHIEELKQNTANVEWDGNVVYYDNFAHTMMNGYSFIGGLEGTALGSFEDEITFRFAGNKANAGRKAMWLLGNVLEYQKRGITLEKIFEPCLNKRVNSVWLNSYKTQAEYYKQYENFSKEVPMTILFDEPEVNFDIMTVWNLYSKAFPAICEESGMQIITVSHSPIVMSQDIIDNPYVNLISIDEDYTKEVKGLLKTMNF
jgi:predicted ATPase